jgi:hypothetical protein
MKICKICNFPFGKLLKDKCVFCSETKDLNYISELYCSGESIRTVAKKTGWSYSSIRNRLLTNETQLKSCEHKRGLNANPFLTQKPDWFFMFLKKSYVSGNRIDIEFKASDWNKLKDICLFLGFSESKIYRFERKPVIRLSFKSKELSKFICIQKSATEKEILKTLETLESAED